MKDITKNFEDAMFATKLEKDCQCPLCTMLDVMLVDINLGSGLD